MYRAASKIGTAFSGKASMRYFTAYLKTGMKNTANGY
jgi:hypothetical protein